MSAVRSIRLLNLISGGAVSGSDLDTQLSDPSIRGGWEDILLRPTTLSRVLTPDAAWNAASSSSEMLDTLLQYDNVSSQVVSSSRFSGLFSETAKVANLMLAGSDRVKSALLKASPWSADFDPEEFSAKPTAHPLDSVGLTPNMIEYVNGYWWVGFSSSWWYSVDGSVWQQLTSAEVPSITIPFGIAWTGLNWVCVGVSGRVWTSPAPEGPWVLRTTPTTSVLYDVAHSAGGRLVAAGGSSAIIVSDDHGVNWSSRSYSNSTTSFYQVACSPDHGSWVLFGSGSTSYVGVSADNAATFAHSLYASVTQTSTRGCLHSDGYFYLFNYENIYKKLASSVSGAWTTVTNSMSSLGNPAANIGKARSGGGHLFYINSNGAVSHASSAPSFNDIFRPGGLSVTFTGFATDGASKCLAYDSTVGRKGFWWSDDNFKVPMQSLSLARLSLPAESFTESRLVNGRTYLLGGSHRLAYTENGADWHFCSFLRPYTFTTTAQNIRGLDYGNGGYRCLLGDGDIYFSVDGKVFERVGNIGGGTDSCLHFDPHSGYWFSSYGTTIRRSIDGVVWTNVSHSLGSTVRYICGNGSGTLVACSDSTLTTLAHSTNGGASFTNSTRTESIGYVFYAKGRFFAVPSGTTDDYLLSSSDGVNWINVSITDVGGAFWHAEINDILFVWEQDRLLFSLDGLTFTKCDSAASNYPQALFSPAPGRYVFADHALGFKAIA